jgi:hypothetical protein
MTFRTRSTAQFDMAVILDQLEQMEHKIEQLSKPSNFNGILPSFLSAGSSVNGTVTVGDVTASGAICFVGIAAGGMTSAALLLSDAQWINPAMPFQTGTVIGFAVCCFRLIYDGILYDLLSNRAPKEDAPQPKPTKVVRPLPVYDDEHQPPEPVVMYELPNGKEVAWSDLVLFLRRATSLYDTWGTKAWSREAWSGESVPQYPPLGNLKTRVWAGIRQLCVEWAVRFSSFVDDNGDSLVWQTNDRVLVEQLIERLKNDDDQPFVRSFARSVRARARPSG